MVLVYTIRIFFSKFFEHFIILFFRNGHHYWRRRPLNRQRFVSIHPRDYHKLKQTDGPFCSFPLEMTLESDYDRKCLPKQFVEVVPSPSLHPSIHNYHEFWFYRSQIL
jgi:hypothetical protein